MNADGDGQGGGHGPRELRAEGDDADAGDLDDGIEREDAPDSDDNDADLPIVTVEEELASRPPSQVRRDAETKGSDDQPAKTVIAIAAGRGGAGKSLLAANVAVYLAQMGKRVVAVDADPAGGALNHMLGAPRPGRGFATFLRGRADNLDELAVDTPVASLRLVGGEAPPFGSARIKASSKRTLAALRAMAADVVVVDLGPPDSSMCVDVWLGADTSILVALADPASIEATYRFLKSAFLRRLRGERGLEKLQAQLGRPLPSPLDLYRVALEIGRTREDEGGTPGAAPEITATWGGSSAGSSGRSSAKPGKVPALASTVAQAMTSFRPRFVLSQTRSLGDTKLGPQIALAARRRLGHTFDYLGHVESDETVAAAGRRRRPVMAEFPEAKICKNIERIVRRILSSEGERPSTVTAPRLEEEQTFYEILETEPGVSDEEIRRAFRSLREIYVSSSPVVSGLFDDAELAALHERANAAHDTLFAPERRRLYDLSLPEADLARAVRRAARAPRIERAPIARSEAETATLPPDLESEVTGPALRRVREARGIELSEVAQRTKISERHLRSIEDERFDELPAPVYVRGFVTEMARILRLDPSRVVEPFLRRFRAANGQANRTPTLKEV